MNLNAIDIKSHTFRSGLRGYNSEEVDAFLELVAEEVNRLQLESKQLKEKNETLTEGLQEVKKRENALGLLLQEANSAREAVLQGAQKDAERIIEEAKVKATRMLMAAERKVQLLENDLHSLEHTKTTTLAHFQSFLESQLTILNNVSIGVEKEIDKRNKPQKEEQKEESNA